jgi:Transposase DDE domain group 1
VKNTGLRPRLQVSADGKGLVSRGGAVLLTRTARLTGLDVALSGRLDRWRAPRAVHDPGKMVLDLDLALMLVLGGDCLADAAMLRSESAPTHREEAGAAR